MGIGHEFRGHPWTRGQPFDGQTFHGGGDRHAKAKFPGKVLEAELENEHGQAVYEIEIASTTGVVTEIKVDAQSGELLDSEVEDQDEREKSEEKDKD